MLSHCLVKLPFDWLVSIYVDLWLLNACFCQFCLGIRVTVFICLATSGDKTAVSCMLGPWFYSQGRQVESASYPFRVSIIRSSKYTVGDHFEKWRICSSANLRSSNGLITIINAFCVPSLTVTIL